MIQLKRNKSHHFYIECCNENCRHNAIVPVTSLLEEYWYLLGTLNYNNFVPYTKTISEKGLAIIKFLTNIVYI